MGKKLVEDKVTFIKNTLMLTFLVAIATIIGYFFRSIGIKETNIVLVYLLAVLIISCFSKGYYLGIIASVVATLAFNYFFTIPTMSFSVDDSSYLITFVIMTTTALITSTLTSRVKQSALDAHENELEAKALYTLTNHLTDAKDINMIASTAVSSISECFTCQAACLCFNEFGIPEKTFVQQVSANKQVHREFFDDSDIKHQMENLRTGYDIGNEFWDWPIYSEKEVLAVIRIPGDIAAGMGELKLNLLKSMIESTSLAMDRFHNVQRQMAAREETVQERYRSNLLRAISHDLRTPLSGIIGTSEMLMDMIEKSDSRYFLAEGIHKDADWLHSLVENILSLTRLQDGKLALHKEAEVVEEVVGGAIAHITKRYPDREIGVQVPNEVFSVPMDAKLIQQVIINLLDNAINHTTPQDEISIMVTKDLINNEGVFIISNSGKGISDENIKNIFQAFYTSRAKMPDAKRGIGLGLTICEAIVSAHKGTIEVHNLKDKEGLEFVFRLPLEVKNNE